MRKLLTQIPFAWVDCNEVKSIDFISLSKKKKALMKKTSEASSMRRKGVVIYFSYIFHSK